MVEQTVQTGREVTPAAGPVADDLDQLTMEELILRWNGVVWWTGIRPMFRRMVEVDLTLAESVVLRSLQRRGLTVAEVADCLYVSQSAASRAVDRLVRDGFIRRQEHPEDRRQKLLTLTLAGAALVKEMESIFANKLLPMMEALHGEEREQLRRLMIRMIDVSASVTDEEEADAWPGACPFGKGGAPFRPGARRTDGERREMG